MLAFRFGLACGGKRELSNDFEVMLATVGVRGSLERDISSLRALGPEGGQISRVVHVSARAAFGVFAEKYGFVQEGHTFIEKVWFRARGAHIS